VDLCEEVAADILKLLQSKYPQFQTEQVENHMECPLCRRSP
jgi:dihydroneopterin aldolase